jgi:hypothetical protein
MTSGTRPAKGCTSPGWAPSARPRVRVRRPRPAGDALAIASGWENLDLRVQFRGSRVHVQIHPDAVEASADPPISALTPAGDTVVLTRAAQTFELSAPTPTSAAAP